MAYFMGLMSGTSLDGIDTVIVDFEDGKSPKLIASHAHTIPDELRQRLISLTQTEGHAEIREMGELDVLLGELFADAALHLLKQAKIKASDVVAIGHHGQTIRHYPNQDRPFTLQIADANIVAERTGISTVADFRRRDMAAGGQGAPLVPAFHEVELRDKTHCRVILNVGGIANITVLPKDMKQPVIGFDTGPGNGLMNNWIKLRRNLEFDDNGAWASTGTANPMLLHAMMQDPYFSQPIPKSTGREYFTVPWMQKHLGNISEISDADVQATLSALTASSVAKAINQYAPKTEQVLVCGGGVHNLDLMKRLGDELSSCQVTTTADYGIEPDWMEAMAFAWLAKRTINRETGNLPAVTGASKAVILGSVYYA